MENEESKSPLSEDYTDNVLVQINDPMCVHKYQFTFLDAEGFYNYRCEKCPMGFRSKEELDSNL